MATSDELYAKMSEEIVAAGGPQPFSHGIVGEMSTVGQFVNCGVSPAPWIDILLKYAPKLRGNDLDMVVRSMARKDCKAAVPFLISVMERGIQKDCPGILWVTGMALYTINDKSSYPRIFKFCEDESLQDGRDWLIKMLPRMRSPKSYELLIKLLKDKTVRAAAIEALGLYGDLTAVPDLKELELDPKLYEWRARDTALRRLQRVTNKKKGVKAIVFKKVRVAEAEKKRTTASASADKYLQRLSTGETDSDTLPYCLQVLSTSNRPKEIVKTIDRYAASQKALWIRMLRASAMAWLSDEGGPGKEAMLSLASSAKSDDDRTQAAVSLAAAGMEREALPLLDEAIERTPRSFVYPEKRGICRYVTGDFSGAYEDFYLALKNGAYADYGSLLLMSAAAHLGDEQRNEALGIIRETAAPASRGKVWIAPVVLFFGGEISRGVLEKEVVSGSRSVERQCEGYFYLGIDHLLKGESAQARACFQKSVDAGVRSYGEYRMARSELERLNRGR